MPRTPHPKPTPARRDELFRGRGVAFLLSQVGAQVSRAWAEQIRPLGLDVREAMLLWHVAREEGRSQRELAEVIGLPESRIVGLVDSLERLGLIERRTGATDRRTRQLHLTDSGRTRVDRLMSIALEHDASFSQSLTAEQRGLLIGLLERIARRQGVPEAVHPDF